LSSDENAGTEKFLSALNMPSVPSTFQVDAENVEFIGHIGGATETVFVEGDYAYIGVGPRLTILNISDLVAPAVVGKTAPLPSVVWDIYVSGDYAYVADGSSGLRVVDVSDPANPTEVGFYNYTPGLARGVYVSDSTAYLAGGSGGLRVLDVSDPANPSEVGFYNDTPGWVWGVYVSSSTAYVADYEAGLRVVDVSDPTTPNEIGSYDTPGEEECVYVSGSIAYVADGDEGLRMVDVSDPTTPTEVGFYDTPGWARGVYVSRGTAYVADGSAGLRVVDVSDPATPTEVGFYDMPEGTLDVYISGSTAYVTDSAAGLRMVDVSDPTTPSEVGSYDTPGSAYGVYVSSNTAYATNGSDGLRVVDVSDPVNPTEVGFYDTPGSAYGIHVSSSTAYVADDESGLRVVNVSDPGTPAEIGFYNTSGGANDVAVSGSTAYVADDWEGLRVVDVSDPANLSEIGYYDTPGYAKGVYVSGSTAYIADGNGGLRVVNVRDLAHPTEVGYCDTLGDVRSVYVSSSIAYVAGGYEGLRMVDVSDLTNPTEVGFYDMLGYAGDVYVSGDTAYVADYEAGLRVLDVSDPANPNEVGFYDTPGRSYELYLSDSTVYIADGDGGLIILRYTGGGPTYTISGRVTEANGSPVAGVTVSAGAGYSAVTDGDGYYTITGLVTDTYTLTPSKSGWTFTPATLMVNVPPDAPGQDFTGEESSEPVLNPVRYDGPCNLPDDSVMIDEEDNHITTGDHVHLQLAFANESSTTITSASVTLKGAPAQDSRPGVQLASDTQGWSPTLVYELGDMMGGEKRYADVWIYIERIDPDVPRSSLRTETYLEIVDGSGTEHIPIAVDKIRFSATDHADMTASDCLHHPNDDSTIAAYAQYAASYYDAPVAVSDEPNSHDPDRAYVAVTNVVTNVENDFHYTETNEPRFEDKELLTRRSHTPPEIGACRHYADLTIGLLRALGLPTRWVAGRLWWPKFEVFDVVQFTAGHAWAEVYLPAQGGWRQADSTWKKALRESCYSEIGHPVRKAWAELYPLGTEAGCPWKQCRCIPSCYEEPVNCAQCEKDSWWAMLTGGPDTSCVTDVTSQYKNIVSLPMLTEAENEQIIIRPQASLYVTRNVPFTLTASVVNSTTTSLDTVTATVAIMEYVDSTSALYEVDDQVCTINNLLPGETVTVTWMMTPLVSGDMIPLGVEAMGGEHFAFEGISQKINEPDTLPDLTLGGTCNGETISPGQSITLTAFVLGEEMQPLTDATLSATVYAVPTEDFSETVSLAYSDVSEEYYFELSLPITVPVGTYRVDFDARHADYDADQATTFFNVSSPLNVTLTANDDTFSSMSTLTLTAEVKDRGTAVADASVWTVVATPADTVTMPLSYNGDNGYVTAFRVSDLVGGMGGDLPAGSWQITATTEYWGGRGSDTLEVAVIRPYSIYLPLVLRNQ
jgi:transglutaminase-like putative cysteine protease